MSPALVAKEVAIMRSVLAPTCMLLVVGAVPADSLERLSPLPAEGEAWRSGSSVTVVYYNYCTGWLFLFGVNRGDEFGVVFDSPHEDAVLAGTDLLQYRWATYGYPYSASLAVYAVDDDGCPVGAPLASQPYQAVWDPDDPTFFVSYEWNVAVPPRFVVTAKFEDWPDVGGDEIIGPPHVLWDHPEGPTGPPACGFCYPAPRPTHSFIFYDGSTSTPYCPGMPVEYNACTAEFVLHARFRRPVSVESASWGGVKALYR
jgi:hypothetical protein